MNRVLDRIDRIALILCCPRLSAAPRERVQPANVHAKPVEQVEDRDDSCEQTKDYVHRRLLDIRVRPPG